MHLSHVMNDDVTILHRSIYFFKRMLV